MPRRNDIVLGPEELILLRGVFDSAWGEMAAEYDLSSTTLEIGRLRLANAVLSAYRSGARDKRMIQATALRRMAMWRHESRFAL
jgi:hypothetical protein